MRAEGRVTVKSPHRPRRLSLASSGPDSTLTSSRRDHSSVWFATGDTAPSDESDITRPVSLPVRQDEKSSVPRSSHALDQHRQVTNQCSLHELFTVQS